MGESAWRLREEMAKKNKLAGCYRRVLVFLLVVVMIILVPSGYIYQRSGGSSGLRYWMAGHTINVIEDHFLNNHPDSLSADQIRREIDLNQLYQLLDGYQERFQNNKPSIDQATQFMRDLELTTLSSESIR